MREPQPGNPLPKFEPDLPEEVVTGSIVAIEEQCREQGITWGQYLQGLFGAYIGDLLPGPGGGGGLVLELEPHLQLLSEIAAESPERWKDDFSEAEKALIANEVAHINLIAREEEI